MRKPYWIRERHNPQFGVYYIGMGRLSKRVAARYESGSLYGDNTMLRFDSEEAYNAKLKELKEAGHTV